MANRKSKMKPQVMGPPAYGSPDPLTSAGKLVSLSQHPLAVLNPDQHTAAISEDYGEVTDFTTETDLTQGRRSVEDDDEGENEGSSKKKSTTAGKAASKANRKQQSSMPKRKSKKSGE